MMADLLIVDGYPLDVSLEGLAENRVEGFEHDQL